MCNNFHLFIENATLTLRINGTPRDLNLLINRSDSGSGWSVRATSERQASVTLDGGKSEIMKIKLNWEVEKTFWWGGGSKPGWIPRLRALSPACNEFLRFTSGATPADCVKVSMAAKPF